MKRPGPLTDRLFSEPFAFDFFQAVRLLQWREPHRPAVGRGGPPSAESVRFRAQVSLAFPPSAIHDLKRPDPGEPNAELTQTFLGMTGPSGVLPRHYTEHLLRLEIDQRGPERRALRDWLDLFHHRLVSHFYRAWEKYRFPLAYERGGFDRSEPDTFTLALLSLIGLGTPGLRNRLRVSIPSAPTPEARSPGSRVDDLGLLRYAGLLAHRPRSAAGLQSLLRDYFGLDVAVEQFQGQWLQLEPPNMTRIGGGPDAANQRLGVNAIAGERVWDVQGKFRLRVGPVGLARFEEFLPLPSLSRDRNAFYLLVHLTRFYVGPELDFDIRLVLRAEDVPDCRLPSGDDVGPALGWNSWLRSGPFDHDADDAVFDADEARRSQPLGAL